MKVDVHSNRTTAASMAIVSVVVYLAMINLQSILMPLAIAILLYFIIKPPEQIIYRKVGNRFVSYGTVLVSGILTVYLISIFLYDNLSQFVDDIPEITAAFEEKRQKYAEADLYGLEAIFLISNHTTSMDPSIHGSGSESQKNAAPPRPPAISDSTTRTRCAAVLKYGVSITRKWPENPFDMR